MKFSVSARSRRAAVSTSSALCAYVVLSGFSTRTCLPAVSARATHSWCMPGGNGTYTASMSSRSSSAW
ncbi:hypothetical protein STENM327S_02145 [Streptomyces tendae]